MLRVAIHTEGESPKVVEFPYDQRITFGRAEDNDIVLPPSYVSRQHGEFVFEDGAWWLCDRGSLTGVTVTKTDGERFQVTSGGRTPLEGGEAIEILHTLLRVEVKPIESLLPLDDEWWGDSAGTVASVASARMESVRGLQHRLASDTHKLERLFELVKDLNQLQTADAVLRRIGATVFEVLPSASHFSVCVLGSEGAFEPLFGMERDGQEVSASNLKVSRSLLGWVAARRMAVLYRPGESPGTLDASMVLQNVASAMAVPLHSAKGTVGVILVENRSSEAPFTEADLNLMIVLASSAASALERARFEAEIQRMFNGFVEASVTAIESRDPATSGHSRRVADYTLALAVAANRSRSPELAPYHLTDTQLRELSYAALLHDFGKVGVSECVLRKAARLYPEQSQAIECRFRELRAVRHAALLRDALLARGVDPETALARVELQMREFAAELDAARVLIERANQQGGVSPAELLRLRALTNQDFVDVRGHRQVLLEPAELESLCIAEGTLNDEERRSMESHVVESHRFLQQIPWSGELERIPEIVVAHHEKLDGSGYPYHRGAGQILPQTRILTVCDIFEAITSIDRPYRSAMPHSHGLDELRAHARAGQVDPALVELLASVRPWERKG
jgi:HD-GYP domain-containing protein (c-di-GMP phosphodiesterase class II)